MNQVRHIRQHALATWQSGERYLHYTCIAVCCVLLLGIAIVPARSSSSTLPTRPTATLLAERYVAATRKIDGIRSVPSVRQAARRYGTTGGPACRWSVGMLHASVRSGRTVDQLALERLRTRLRTYCPHVDERYGAWLRARELA